MKIRNLFLKDPDYFYKVCTEALNKHIPRKKKHVYGKNKRFKNKALKYPTKADRMSYSKQRNFCTSLLREDKKIHFADLNLKYIKTFGKL